MSGKQPRHVVVRQEVLRCIEGLHPCGFHCIADDGRLIRDWVSYSEMLQSPELRSMRLADVEEALRRLAAEGLIFDVSDQGRRYICVAPRDDLALAPSTCALILAAGGRPADFDPAGAIVINDAETHLTVVARSWAAIAPARVLTEITVFGEGNRAAAERTYERAAQHLSERALKHGIHLDPRQAPFVDETQSMIVGVVSGVIASVGRQGIA